MSSQTLIVFSKEGCPPCKTLQAVLPDLTDEFGCQVRIVKLEEDAAQFAMHRVSRTPTTLVLDAGGQELGRVEGADAGKIARLLRNAQKTVSTVLDF